ncbi:VOC family protein [Chryseolinea sp. T2]|uniref:VOC family protein n=1 Tax=Chryseolinea sp. T2 TaxID=3129255 RepID=UPI0030769DEB
MRKILIILTLMAMKTAANSQSIQYADAYSVYITEHLNESRDFYVRWLDFQVVFEATWFVYLQSQGERPVSFALIDVNHPSTPPSYGSFNKRGSFFTLQVNDAKAVFDTLVKRGAPITYKLKQEEWGQLRFGLTDPNGLYIDIVEQIEPAPGYWEKYSVKD